MAENVENAVALAEAAASQEVFDFAAAVQNRSYPEIVVPIYIDERTVQAMLDAERERNELEVQIANSPNPTVEQADRLTELDEIYSEAVKALREQKYEVRIKGISPEKAVEIEDFVFERFPREYEDETNHLTGVTKKVEIPCDERDAVFTTLLRQAHLVSVTAPNGAIDSDFENEEKVRLTWARMPFVARTKVDQAIGEVTIAVDYYLNLVDEVF